MAFVKCFLKKVGDFIKKESESLRNRGLEIPRDYFEEKEVSIDMCKAMEDNNKKKEVTGAIKGMRLMGASDNDIVNKITEAFHVTKEYVLALLAPQKA